VACHLIYFAHPCPYYMHPFFIFQLGLFHYSSYTPYFTYQHSLFYLATPLCHCSLFLLSLFTYSRTSTITNRAPVHTPRIILFLTPMCHFTHPTSLLRVPPTCGSLAPHIFVFCFWAYYCVYFMYLPLIILVPHILFSTFIPLK